jgi:hypothetical protein
VPDTVLLVLFWILIGIILFGLVRLSIARRGTDEDWAALVAFGKRLPVDLNAVATDPARWSAVLASAPPGLLPPPAAPGTSSTSSPQALQERLRAYQAMLQAEMKWYVRRLTNPYQWFMAGIRGLVLLPLGLGLEFEAGSRARRRALEQDADFQRVVSATLGVFLFVALVALGFGANHALAWYRVWVKG